MIRKVLKIVKWLIIIFIVLLLLLAGGVYLILHKDSDGYFGISSVAKSILFGTSGNVKGAEEKLQGIKKMKNDWREFNFNDIKGETPYMVFGTESSPALGKYFVQDIKIYKNIGFVTGDDREEVQDKATAEDIGTIKIEQRMKAYVFITKDNGKTFEKQCFGHGTAIRVARANDDFYLTVAQLDTNTGDVYKSEDQGETWKKVEFRPWAVINQDIMIARISPAKITYDGGKTWKKPSLNLQAYIRTYGKYPFPEPYKNKLVVLRGRNLIFFNLESDKEEIVPLNVPKGKIIDDSTLHSDEETGELSLRLFHDVVGNPRLTQSSIWFPLEDKEVIFDKKLPETVYLEVHGKYIGGFTKVEGVLTHIWTLDKGEHWQYELLPNYFWEHKKGYGNGEIWMEAYVKGKKDLEDGSYLVMCKLKDYE